jgi:hypothetical protein
MTGTLAQAARVGKIEVEDDGVDRRTAEDGARGRDTLDVDQLHRRDTGHRLLGLEEDGDQLGIRGLILDEERDERIDPLVRCAR